MSSVQRWVWSTPYTSEDSGWGFGISISKEGKLLRRKVDNFFRFFVNEKDRVSGAWEKADKWAAMGMGSVRSPGRC
jgi:hypothetical protein